MKDLARTLYERLVKEYPDSPLAAEAKKKLE
jgi:TolA-binding protein